jgi:ATP-dependent helicase YprA (DUF1998 family)
MRQQAGRAGRREQPSMAIYVAFDGPLDQHFMRKPEDLFERKIESAQVPQMSWMFPSLPMFLWTSSILE